MQLVLVYVNRPIFFVTFIIYQYYVTLPCHVVVISRNWLFRSLKAVIQKSMLLSISKVAKTLYILNFRDLGMFTGSVC